MAEPAAPSTLATINVGSRCSELALCQTNLVISKLKEHHPDLQFKVIKMTTKGDQIQDKALSKIGGKSLFTKELEVALDNNTVDFVVHSLKDLPTTLPPGLTVGAVIARNDPRDCVVLHTKHRAVTRLSALPAGSVLGTSSLRRIAQLAGNYPQLRFENIRGNLNTRLRKLDEDGMYDGIVLAAAGIERLGWKERVNIWLEKHDMLYAIGQGAMAVECRESDVKTITLLSEINDADTAIRVTAERTLMKELDGGCSVPIGTWSVIDKYSLTVSGAVFSVDGSEMLFSERSDAIPAPRDVTMAPRDVTMTPRDVTMTTRDVTVPSHDMLFNERSDLMPGTQHGFRHQVIDMIHLQRPKLTAHFSAITSLLNNNIILHRTGTCCRTADVTKFNIAENCGRQLAKALLAKGAKDVLDRARAQGIVNVNKPPEKQTAESSSSEQRASGAESADAESSSSGQRASGELASNSNTCSVPLVNNSRNAIEPPYKKYRQDDQT